jgi:hypothetical protein
VKNLSFTTSHITALGNPQVNFVTMCASSKTDPTMCEIDEVTTQATFLEPLRDEDQTIDEHSTHRKKFVFGIGFKFANIPSPSLFFPDTQL